MPNVLTEAGIERLASTIAENRRLRRLHTQSRDLAARLNEARQIYEDALIYASQQFYLYAEYHRQKGTEEALDKAVVNEEMAARCVEAIAKGDARITGKYWQTERAEAQS